MKRLLFLFALIPLALSGCKQSNADYFQGVADALNRKLPQRVDNEVTREKVKYEADTNTFIFTYLVNGPSQEIRRKYNATSLLPNMRKVAQMNRDDVLTRNVNYAMHYTSTVDKQTTTVKYNNEELRRMLSEK